MTRRFQDLASIAARGGTEALTLSKRECLDATRAYAAECRGEIRRRHDEGESGSQVVRLLSNAADTILRGVFHFALACPSIPHAVRSRLCLCAQGGYGRAELSPASDLDVCLLYEGKLDKHIEALNDFLVPFLWDSGFVVGYAIRNVKEAQEVAHEDIRTFTSMLEARQICGESSVFARLKLHVREMQAGPLAKEFVRHKIHDRFENLPEEHGDLFAPEPNIKENAGGLRDFHTALWLLMMAYDVANLDEVVAQGLITSDEQLDFVEGLDFVWRIRNELHFRARNADDTLSYENQRHVAKAFGYESTRQSSVLLLMQDYYAAAGKLRRFLRIAADICDHSQPTHAGTGGDSPPPDWIIEEGQLFVGLGDEKWFTHNPVRLMEVFWKCTRNHVQLSRSSARLLTRNLHLVTDSFRSNDLVRRFFMAICSRPLECGRALRQAAGCGLLGRYLPEFEAIRGVLRYEDFHHYPVDEHTLLAIESLSHIPEMEGNIATCLLETIENLSDPHILVLAILFHDLGKAAGEVHADESVALAHQICSRIGMPEEDEERITFLVKHHMLMNTISQYRDINDEDIVRSFAETVQTEDRLRALFLLSFADLFAVGPNVWNDWKGTLLLQLYLKTVKRLLGRAETVGEEFWLSAKADEVRAETSEDLKAEVADHLRGLGQRYFVAFTPRHIAEHLECIRKAHSTGLALHAVEDRAGGQSDVVVCTRDRHGLFSMLAGAFSSQLIDVTSAAVFTRPDGVVVDRFTVTDAHQRRALTRRQIGRIRELLTDVLLHGKPIEEYVEQSRRRLFALFQPRIPVPTRITFDNDSSREHTVIDIETGDRTGLLYDISRAMAAAGLDITTAHIVTDARRVRDSFYVSRNGTQVVHESEQEAIRKGIHDAIYDRASVD